MKATLGCLRHVVLFKFREDTPEREIKIIENAYLPHPAHETFKQLLTPHLEKSLVIDYFSRQ